jgi:hypothetical protein
MRRNVAGQFVTAKLINKADGTPCTSGTTTVYVTGDAGTQAAGSVGSGAATHEGNGVWSYAPAQAETNYTQVDFVFVNTNAVNAGPSIYPTAYDANGRYDVGAVAGTAQTARDLGAQLDAAVSTRMATYTQPTGFLAATFPATVASTTNITAGTITTVTNLTNLPTIPANWLTAAGMDATASAEIADAVWDEAISGHLGAGSTGAALNAAGSAGDPWTTPLPGAYGAGTAGFIIGTNLDTTVGSRSSLDAAGVRTAVGLASANLDTQLGDLPTAVENADALLGRNVSGGSSSGRTVKQAFHFIRNRWVVAAGTLTVYDTDDSTQSWTSAVTGTAGADPITGTDPA